MARMMQHYSIFRVLLLWQRVLARSHPLHALKKSTPNPTTRPLQQTGSTCREEACPDEPLANAANVQLFRHRAPTETVVIKQNDSCALFFRAQHTLEPVGQIRRHVRPCFQML